MTSVRPSLREGLPDFTLASTTGERVRISDYRGRRNLVLLFTGDSWEASLVRLISSLAEHYAAFRSEEAEILLIACGPFERAEELSRALPFPVLWDPCGVVHRKYGAVTEEGRMRAALYVADRYGEICLVVQAADGQPLPSAEHILSWVRFAEAQCPE